MRPVMDLAGSADPSQRFPKSRPRYRPPSLHATIVRLPERQPWRILHFLRCPFAIRAYHVGDRCSLAFEILLGLAN